MRNLDFDGKTIGYGQCVEEAGRLDVSRSSAGLVAEAVPVSVAVKAWRRRRT